MSCTSAGWNHCLGRVLPWRARCLFLVILIVGAPCRRWFIVCGLSRPPARYFSLLRRFVGALQALGLLDAGFRARTARYFLLLAQEKVPKEKGPRSTHRVEFTRPLRSLARAFLANPGAAHNSQSRCARKLKQGARLFPGLAAVLGECYGRGRSKPSMDTVVDHWLQYSVGTAGGVDQNPSASLGVDLPSRSTHRVPQPIRGIAAHPV